MDRFFLAVTISGLLLAATSMSLLVVTGGDITIAELRIPPPALPAERIRPRPAETREIARDDR